MKNKFVILIIILLLIFTIYFIIVILSNKILSNNYSDNNSSSNNLSNETISFPINPITTSQLYKFPTHPLSFYYPSDLVINEVDKDIREVVELKYKDSILKIAANQQGIGFEEPAPEMTNVDLIVDGKEVFIDNQKITKTKLNYVDSNTIGYLVFIRYPEEFGFEFSVFANYGFEDDIEDQETIEVFDRIISTISFEKLSTYSNSSLPGLNITYPSDWELQIKEFSDPNTLGFDTEYFSECNDKCMGFRFKKESVSLDITLVQYYDGMGMICSNSVDYQEIGNNWVRIKGSNGYFYNPNYQTNFSTMTTGAYTLGELTDEWNYQDDQIYKICLFGSGRPSKIIKGSSDWGILIENARVKGMPDIESLRELDIIVKSLN